MAKRIAKYVDGRPTDLESTANDALTWLEFYEERSANGARISTTNLEKLRETIASLKKHLADVDIQFFDTTAA